MVALPVPGRSSLRINLHDPCEGGAVTLGHRAEAGAVDVFNLVNSYCLGAVHILPSGAKLVSPFRRSIICKSGHHV